MAEVKNGNGTMKILSWIGGTTLAVLGLSFTIYTNFHVPLASALSQEKDCRQQEDAAIRKEVSTKLENIKEQNSQMAITLAELRSDMKYLKRTERPN